MALVASAAVVVPGTGALAGGDTGARAGSAGSAGVAGLALTGPGPGARAGAGSRPTTAQSAPPTGGSAEPATFEQVAADPDLTADHARLFRLYWAFFNRPPDTAGARYWVGVVDRCTSPVTVAESFAAGDEFRLRYSQTDNRAFVEQIYRNVLGRDGDPSGIAYWLDTLQTGRLDRGGVVLYIALSPELAARHPYPSDPVPARACVLPDGRLTGRTVDLLDPAAPPPLATVAGLTLVAPAAVIERAGFHEASHPGALALDPADPAPIRLSTLPSRRRGTHARSAIDIVVEPTTPIVAPISGTVDRAGTYALYCRYRDSYVVIRPDGRPDLEVKLLHVRDLTVRAGQRVEAGDRVAGRATLFPFRSQVDAITGEPSWPHVHIEVVDPSVPRPPSGGC